MAVEDEPELWVLEDDDEDGIDVPAGSDDPESGLAATLTSDDVAGDDWADTSWLDELTAAPHTAGGAPTARDHDVAGTSTADAQGTDRAADAPGGAPGSRPMFVDAPPEDVTAAGSRRPTTDDLHRSTSADEFAGLKDSVAPTPPRDETNTADGQPPESPSSPADGPPARHRRPRPAARGDEVSEFLRELSRLALDDDD